MALCNTAYYLTSEFLFNNALPADKKKRNKTDALYYLESSILPLKRCKKENWKKWYQHEESRLYVLNELNQIDKDELRQSLNKMLSYKYAQENKVWCEHIRVKWKAILTEENED